MAAALVVSLGACSALPWTSSSEPLSTTSASPTPVKTPGKVATIVNELAGGTTIHEVTAGNIGLKVNYYSQLNMNQWTYSANKPVSLSMSASAPVPKKQKIYLASLTMDTTVTGPKGSLTAPAQVSDQATVSPGYLIKSPYTYSQTFILPAVDKDATSVTLTFTYELLLQSTPQSHTYAKQTAVDTLTIAIAH